MVDGGERLGKEVQQVRRTYAPIDEMNDDVVEELPLAPALQAVGALAEEMKISFTCADQDAETAESLAVYDLVGGNIAQLVVYSMFAEDLERAAESQQAASSQPYVHGALIRSRRGLQVRCQLPESASASEREMISEVERQAYWQPVLAHYGAVWNNDPQRAGVLRGLLLVTSLGLRLLRPQCSGFHPEDLKRPLLFRRRFWFIPSDLSLRSHFSG